MILNKINTIIISLTSVAVLAQNGEVKKDTIKTFLLDEVVVTSQYNAQSIKKSVHNVVVISRKQIENQAANNLVDVLNFNLNLTIIPNAKTGKSSISFFGLNAGYFNILVDGIPLVGDNSLGNDTDLTQVNLDDVERIEIVEGAMGVEYGANAVSGVINVITKKKEKAKWSIKTALQEETIGKEYAWFDKGRHIQSVSISHNINKNWYIRFGANRNQFAGFYNKKQGQDYYQNDGLRGYEWLPKNQLTTNGMLSYKRNRFKLFYKLEYFNEDLAYYDETVRANIDVQNQISNPSSTDRNFKTKRFVNNLNINGSLNYGANYNISLSFQQQKKRLNEFNYYIVTKQKTDEKEEVYQSSKVFFSKGTITNLVKNNFLNFQLGFDNRYIKGFDTQATGNVTQLDRTQSQFNYALFGSAELNVSEKFLVRPGVRYEHNSKFKSKFLTSLSGRYLLNNGFEFRANIGTSYRTPNFEELYYYFVDSNHDVQGNENLHPESGFSAFLNLKKYSYIDNVSLLNSFKISYIDVQDKIDLAVVNTSPLQYKYINIDAYKLWGITTENIFKTTNWTLNIGATLQGVSRIANNEINGKNDLLYSYQINTSATYHLEKWDTSFSLLLKHNSKQRSYIATSTDSLGNSIFSKSTTDSYTWLDASIKKTFFNNNIQTTIGSRNLLNITNVTVNNSLSTGAHATGNNSLLLGYGRSYYFKILYNLNL